MTPSITARPPIGARPRNGAAGTLGPSARLDDPDRLIAISALPLSALAIFLLHAPLALAMHRMPTVATLHALATVALGVTLALGGRLERVAYAAAYIAGAEVLWRMCGADVFWEFGKYATAAVLLVTLARLRPLHWLWMPLAYFALLVPSAALTVVAVGLGAAREPVSFNLSGPFALMLCVWVFSHQRLPPARMRRVVIAFVAPVMGIMAISLYSTLTADVIDFTSESNPTTSGGFGPNQVSAILGLGALLTFLASIERSASKGFRLLMFGVALLLAGQSALTFSRGGLVGAGAAAAVALFYLLRDSRSRYATITAVVLLIVAATYVVLPRLDAFTGGTLSSRFATMDLTQRDDLAKDDIRIFGENPFFGVGPGEARNHRLYGSKMAHTEFTRALAEHGTFGLIGLGLLMVMGLRRLRAAPTATSKAIVASLLAWACVTMLHAAMRTAAPAFIFGLAFARFGEHTPRANSEPPDPDEDGVPTGADPDAEEHPV